MEETKSEKEDIRMVKEHMKRSSMSLAFREEMQTETNAPLLEWLKLTSTTTPENNKHLQGCGASGPLIQGDTKWNNHFGNRTS